MLKIEFYSAQGEFLLTVLLSADEAINEGLMSQIMDRVRLGQPVAFNLEKVSFSFAAGVVGYAVRSKEFSK